MRQRIIYTAWREVRTALLQMQVNRFEVLGRGHQRDLCVALASRPQLPSVSVAGVA